MELDIKFGEQLPDDTPVYYILSVMFPETDERHVFCTHACKVKSMLFYYSSEDGLWATILARNHWKLHPASHPHSTLFQMLKTRIGCI